MLLSAGYWHFVQARSTIRTRRHPRGLAPPDVVRRVQRPAGREPIPLRTQDRRLRRHTRDAIRQRVRDPADRERAPGAAAPQALLRAAERLAHGRAAQAARKGRKHHPRVITLGGTTQSCFPCCARSTARTARSRSSTLTRTSTRGSRACSEARRASALRSTTGRTFIGRAARDSSQTGAPLQVSLSLTTLPFPLNLGVGVRIVGILVTSFFPLFCDSTAQYARRSLVQRTIRTTMNRGSSGSKLARSTRLVRGSGYGKRTKSADVIS
jgi:hypothetical protein